jgi:hypothetical protein
MNLHALLCRLQLQLNSSGLQLLSDTAARTGQHTTASKINIVLSQHPAADGNWQQLV